MVCEGRSSVCLGTCGCVPTCHVEEFGKHLRVRRLQCSLGYALLAALSWSDIVLPFRVGHLEVACRRMSCTFCCSAPCTLTCELSLVLTCSALVLLTLTCSYHEPCVRLIYVAVGHFESVRLRQ